MNPVAIACRISGDLLIKSARRWETESMFVALTLHIYVKDDSG